MDAILMCFCVFAASVVLWYLKYFYECSKLKGINGPTVLPFFGNSFFMSSPTTIVSTLLEYHKRFNGKIFRIFIGTQPYLFICEAKYLERILSSSVPLKKSKPYRFLFNWLGTGLLTSHGKKWAKHRKIITPAFHFKILEDFIHVFNNSQKRFVDKLSREVGKNSFNIYPYVANCALDIICETAMGTSVNAQEDSNSQYVTTVAKMGELFSRRTFSPIFQNSFIYKFSPLAAEERSYLDILHAYTRKIIKDRRIELFSNGVQNSEKVDDFGIKRRRAFLDLLLEYQMQDPTFTDENIREEVDTFTFEGHETTASTVAFAIYSLSVHPDIQKKAFDEIKDILQGDAKRQFTLADLQEMKYLEMVIKETLRLYTTVPIFGRELTEDFDMDGIILPKGLMLSLYAMGIHRDPLHFKDPEIFNPERFSPENTKGRSPYCFIPFSAGPRNCIGQKFAMLEMKVTIASLLREFIILPSNPETKLKLQSTLVLKSDTEINVRLEKRIV